MTMTVDLLLIGEGPLAEEVRSFFREKGARVFSPDEAGVRRPVLDAVVDVVSGPADVKREGLIRAESLIDPHTPVFSSALYVGATRVASWLKHPERVAGFSPLHLGEMEVMEVSRPLQAEEEPSWEEHLRWWERFGKQVEIVGDEPGLVFPRTLALLVNESAFALTEGVASAEDIDTAMKKGTNYPYGPLEWADRVGVDQVLWVLKGLFEELGDDRYRPASLLRRMVYANRTGRSTGRGFHRYG